MDDKIGSRQSRQKHEKQSSREGFARMLACYPPPTLLAGQEFATNLLLKNMGSCSCLTQHPLPLVLSLDLRLVALPAESSAGSVFVCCSAVVPLSPPPLKLQSALHVMASPCPSKSSPADSFSGSLSFGIMVYAIKILLLRVLWCLPSNNNSNKDGLFLFGLHERSLID